MVTGTDSPCPGPDSVELVDVPRSPRWFESGDLSNVPAAGVRMQTGVLIDITVPEQRTPA